MNHCIPLYSRPYRCWARVLTALYWLPAWCVRGRETALGWRAAYWAMVAACETQICDDDLPPGWSLTRWRGLF